MARMVKCNATGVVGDSSTFYKVNNKWHQSEDVYLDFMGDKAYRVEVIKKLLEFLNEDRLYGNIGGFVGKKIKDCGMSCKELYESLCDKEVYIKENLCDKSKFANPCSQITAIFTVASTIPESITYGGCYEIKNLDNGEVYIGETLDFFTRMNTHISDLYANRHHCKALQDAFNECHDISHFKFTPLCLYGIKGKDREMEKHNTLYLECAYFLKYKKEKKTLYNTVNPYVALKEKSVSLENYTVNCKKVLELLLEDKQNILPAKVKEKIEKDLK